MKCDELRIENACVYGPDAKVYLAEQVDAAIAELKARIADLEKLNHDLCERVTENDDIRLHWEEIEQTRAENERLKAKLENVQASAYADSVDAGMRERRLQRALWLARANSAESQFFYWCAHLSMESGFTKVDIRGYTIDTNRKLRTIGEWIEVWKNIKSKCRAKAEEYE